MLARCDVCGVEYVEYEGPCQEWLLSVTGAQILRGNPPMCGGTVNLVATLERRIAELERPEAKGIGVSALSDRERALRQGRAQMRWLRFKLGVWLLAPWLLKEAKHAQAKANAFASPGSLDLDERHWMGRSEGVTRILYGDAFRDSEGE